MYATMLNDVLSYKEVTHILVHSNDLDVITIINEKQIRKRHEPLTTLTGS